MKLYSRIITASVLGALILSRSIDAQVMFSDNFDSGRNPAWIASGVCSWQIVNGEVRTSNYDCQTHCYLSVGDDSWTDYRLELDMTGYAGADKVFSFRGYYIDFRSAPINDIHLERTGLDIVKSFPNVNGTRYHFKVECVGPRIRVSVNGTPVFDYVDNPSPLLSGGVQLQLYSGGWCAADVGFDNVVVTKMFERPVVLVHGWRGANSDFDQMKGWLQAAGFAYVWPVQLDACGNAIEDGFTDLAGFPKKPVRVKNVRLLFKENARKLGAFIQSMIGSNNLSGRIADVDVVAHSMGGLVTRRYLNARPDLGDNWTVTPVRDFFMLGTPNNGSGWGATLAAQSLQYAKSPCGNEKYHRAWAELGTDQMLVFNSAFGYTYPHNTTQFRIFFGTRSCFSKDCTYGLPGLGLYCPNDGAVHSLSVLGRYYISNTPYNAYSGWSASLCHTDLITTRDVCDNVIAPFLRGQFSLSEDIQPAATDDSLNNAIAYHLIDSILAGNSRSDSLEVEPCSEFTMSFAIADTLGLISLRSPSGQIIDSGSTLPDSSIYVVNEPGLIEFHIANPESGKWHWTVSNSSTDAYFEIIADYVNAVRITGSQNENVAGFHDTLALNVVASDAGSGITGLSVRGCALGDNGDTLRAIQFLDDGKHADGLASDGTYGFIDVNFPGGLLTYDVTITGATSIGHISRSLHFSVFVPGTCCTGTTGNADGSADDVVDISDVFALVDYLGSSVPLSSCPTENDVNTDGTIDISDLFAVIDYLSGSAVLPNCP